MISLHPLGDLGALARFADEGDALHWAAAVRRAPPFGCVEVVQAYRSVAVYFDLEQTTFAVIGDALNELTTGGIPDAIGETLLHEIPCCYEFALDLPHIAEATGLAAEEVVRLHVSTEYAIYAIGFCPGFPYLGYLPSALCGVPRLPAPRLRVEAGSVGLTGRQTGIYTEARPGGWNLIGRTPLTLVSVEDNYFPLRTGDRVRFVRIDAAEFERLRGESLHFARECGLD